MAIEIVDLPILANYSYGDFLQLCKRLPEVKKKVLIIIIGIRMINMSA